MWILISWFLMKPADQELHGFKKLDKNFKQVLGGTWYFSKIKDYGYPFYIGPVKQSFSA